MIPRVQFEPQATASLSGLRVLDLSRLVAGNMASVQLADQGAEVIKIEDPAKGDPLRAWREDGISFFWKVYARNKKSLALDLRHPEGRALLGELAETSHVLIENYRPGTLERMDLAPSTLQERNPRLVILRISGFGQTGPYRDRPGFGTLIEAMSGFAAKNGHPDRPPALPPTALADMIAGLYGAYAVMVALRAAERDGSGQVIDLPLLDPMVSVLGPDAAIYGATGRKPERTGSRSLTTSPRNTFATKDGRFIAISASIQANAERLFRAIGRADLIEDPRFRSNSDRLRNVESCEAPIAAFIAARSLEETMAVFQAAEVTAIAVYEIDQFLEDPHVQARGLMVEVPDDDAGSVLMHDVVPRLSDTPGKLRHPAPRLGQHTREILLSIGYGDARIAALSERGVVREA
jgi:crotonobetainyl-CoA:carnitine CoA-transferase CaiB-like acyl-CoA transferase